MSVRPLVVAVLIGSIAGGFVLCGKRLSSATRSAERARGMLQEAEAQAAVLRAARDTSPWMAVRTPVESDLSPRLLEAMESAGIGATHMKSVRQVRDSTVGTGQEGTTRRRTVSASIEGVTMAQVVAYLDAWEREVPEWTIARVEVQRDTKGSGAGGVKVELVRTYASDMVARRTLARATGG